MKIAILTMGTRGDVQPYAVLGQALKASGHEVALATAKNFEMLVKSYELDFIPVEADFQALLESEEGKRMMKGNPFAVWRNLNNLIYPLITNSLCVFYELSVKSDMVLYHVKTLADSFADQFPHKMIRASVLPIVEPTSAFANPAFSGLPIPKFLYKLSYTFANQSIRLLSNPIGKFRAKFNLPKKFTIPETSNLYGLSAHLLPLPNDYASSSVFSGFWFGQASAALPDDILAFIEAKGAPLLITFGSMPFKSKFDIQAAILKIVSRFNTSVILVRGWGLQHTPTLDKHPQVKVIDAAPYEKLFPLTKAIVHHGGIGTTSECIRAGKPFMICPILHPIGDQQFWGEVAQAKGIALPPIPLRHMRETQFLDCVSRLLHEDALYQNAKTLQAQLHQENGLQAAIDIIERHATLHP